MSSERRINSSRANGAKSHGPVTPEGLAANTLVLANESRELFQAMLQDYIDEIQPTSRIQMDLIQQMAAAKWRQQRLWTAETASLDLTIDRQHEILSKEFVSIDGPTRLAIAFQSTSANGTLGLFHRYETSMRRSWDRALDRLERLRAQSRKLPDTKFPSEPSPENEQS